MRKPLTKKQQAVFQFLREFFYENDQLPPIASIAKRFGCFQNAITDTMKELERHEMIERNCIGKWRFVMHGRAAL